MDCVVLARRPCNMLPQVQGSRIMQHSQQAIRTPYRWCFLQRNSLSLMQFVNRPCNARSWVLSHAKAQDTPHFKSGPFPSYTIRSRPAPLWGGIFFEIIFTSPEKVYHVFYSIFKFEGRKIPFTSWSFHFLAINVETYKYLAYSIWI